MAKIFDDSRHGGFPMEEFLNRGKESSSQFDSGRTPPQAVDVEQTVLGAILIDPDALNRALDVIDEDCFYKPAHKILMETIIDMSSRNEPIDMVTITQELRRKNQLEASGGAVYISELTSKVSTSANIDYHARIVLEKFILRRVITIAGDLAKNACDGEGDAFDILDQAEQKLFQISSERLRLGAQSIGSIITTTLERLESIHGKSDGVTGVGSGFVDLDKLTSGFQPSDLIILAARPSMGKTSFALTSALKTAIKDKNGVLIFSLEMSARQLVERMLCSEARVDAHQLRTGRLPESEWPKLSRAAGRLSEANILIDDTPGLGVMELRAKSRRLKAEKNIKMIVVDYLQLLHGPKNSQSREQEISAISRSLKALAKELDVPVIALSQLSRAVEARNPKRPMLSDLRESGAIEQDADVVMFIYRPEFYGEKETEDGSPAEGMAEIIVGKHRNGPVGTVVLQFNKQFAAFENRITQSYQLHEPVGEMPINPADFGEGGNVPF